MLGAGFALATILSVSYEAVRHRLQRIWQTTRHSGFDLPPG
jgi:hypothetical protein